MSPNYQCYSETKLLQKVQYLQKNTFNIELYIKLFSQINMQLITKSA